LIVSRHDELAVKPATANESINSKPGSVVFDLQQASTSSDTPTYPLQDGLGSVRLTVDDSGTALGSREWDAWGNQRSSTGSGFAFGWAGEQYDASSDLTYLRARYYSPGTAQFLSRDTMQPNAGGTTGYNPYCYANANPATLSDGTPLDKENACSIITLKRHPWNRGMTWAVPNHSRGGYP
jgi:RHS repeat-associated protein